MSKKGSAKKDLVTLSPISPESFWLLRGKLNKIEEFTKDRAYQKAAVESAIGFWTKLPGRNMEEIAASAERALQLLAEALEEDELTRSHRQHDRQRGAG